MTKFLGTHVALVVATKAARDRSLRSQICNHEATRILTVQDNVIETKTARQMAREGNANTVREGNDRCYHKAW